MVWYCMVYLAHAAQGADEVAAMNELVATDRTAVDSDNDPDE